MILEATFSKPGGDPQADYFNDRKRTGTKIYTLEPAAFVLPRLAAAEPLRSFKASSLSRASSRDWTERAPRSRTDRAGCRCDRQRKSFTSASSIRLPRNPLNWNIFCSAKGASSSSPT